MKMEFFRLSIITCWSLSEATPSNFFKRPKTTGIAQKIETLSSEVNKLCRKIQNIVNFVLVFFVGILSPKYQQR